MINEFIYAQPVKIFFGQGEFQKLGAVLDELGDGYAFQGVLTPSATPTPAADIPQG